MRYTQHPSKMQSVVALSFCDPSLYELSKQPKPTITGQTDVIIRVHASSINPVDVKKAAGAFKMALKDEFPYKIGYDCAGIITEVGEQVSNFKVGDEVFTRLPEASRGAWSEYAKCDVEFISSKPPSLSFGDAASLPLAAMTAFQALKKYNGSLSGKTVFVPAGLGGTGSYACQLAKNVFQAGKVITTVSTSKVNRITEFLGEGVVDQVIDYTKDDPMQMIPPGSVDFVFDTTGQAMQFLSLMVPSTSLIISISLQPSGTQLQASSVMRRPDNPRLPWFVKLALDFTDSIRRARARRWNVDYQYLFLDTNGKDLTALANYVEGKKLVPVVGSRVNMQDVDKLREACLLVYHGKGGIGKTVIEINQSQS